MFQYIPELIGNWGLLWFIMVYYGLLWFIIWKLRFIMVYSPSLYFSLICVSSSIADTTKSTWWYHIQIYCDIFCRKNNGFWNCTNLIDIPSLDKFGLKTEVSFNDWVTVNIRYIAPSNQFLNYRFSGFGIQANAIWREYYHVLSVFQAPAQFQKK